MVQPGMGRQEERKELEGNKNGRIARRDSREFLSNIPYRMEMMLGEEDKFFWNYRSKFPGFRKHELISIGVKWECCSGIMKYKHIKSLCTYVY
jgi:hypothetical protein